jgi:hypothetical protein
MSDTDAAAELGIEARIAARWWADKIRDGFALRDGAEPYAGTLAERSGGLSDVLQCKLAEHITPEKVDRYERELAQRVQAEIVDAYGDPARTMTRYFAALALSVDYGPSRMHQEALAAAGLPDGMGMLPLKTTMWVEPGRVSVGDGYAAEPRELPLGEVKRDD